MAALPLDDDRFSEAGLLVAAVPAVALAGADALLLGWAEDADDGLAEAEDVDVDDGLAEAEEVAWASAACVDVGVKVGVGVEVGVGVVQVEGGSGVVPTAPLPGSADLMLRLGDGVTVAVEVPLGLGLGLGLRLGLGLGLELALPLAGVLVLELAMLPLPWLRLDDVAGAAVVWVALLGGLVVVCVADGCVEDDGQEVVGAGTTTGTLAELSAGVGAGVLPLSSVVPGLLEDEEVLILRAEPMASPICTIAWRAGGTADRTTPTVNTAAPTAKAGRSIASRQSLGRCGSRRAWRRPPAPPLERSGWSPPRAGPPRKPRRWTRAVMTPEKASQTASTPLGRLAWAGRDRILSRIRSRPSAPGST